MNMRLIEEHKSNTERRCPNNCLKGIIPGLLLNLKDVKYCPNCGAEIIEEQVPYIIFVCSKCGNSVIKDWHYCPYCGEKKESCYSQRNVK